MYLALIALAVALAACALLCWAVVALPGLVRRELDRRHAARRQQGGGDRPGPDGA